MSPSHFPDPQGQFASESVVTLIDEAERSLECYVERSLEIDGSTYLMLLPIDSPITIIAWESEEESAEATWLEDNQEIAQVLPDAKAVLAEHNLTLKQTAFTLTAAGELPPHNEDDILTLEVEEQGGQIISEEFQYLTSFYYHQQHYEIYSPLTPLLFFAKSISGEELELLAPEDFQKIQPLLEDILFEDLE